MEITDLDLLIINEKIKQQREEEKSQRPFLQLEIEDYPVYQEKKEPDVEPRRVIVIDL
tara:strand:+ start:420 stop:593 length:174 start_codon:yes stop_codon:yes gene_type:complete